MPTKKPTHKTAKKVLKVEQKTKVVMLHCPNCGEDDEKVIYCSQCDSPMDVVKVVERDEDEIDVDVDISKEKAGEPKEEDLVVAATTDPGVADPEIDSLIEKGGLDNIFAGGDETDVPLVGSDDDETDPDMSPEDMISALDEE